MRLSITKSKKTTSYYVIEDVYVEGKRTTRTIEKLGTTESICANHDTTDALAWAKQHVKAMKQKKTSAEPVVTHPFTTSKQIPLNQQVTFNGGYLFLQLIYHQLKLHVICDSIRKDHECEFDLNTIVSRIVYSKLLFPVSKFGIIKHSQQYLEPCDIELHEIYRSFETITSHLNEIQQHTNQAARKILPINPKVLYYDYSNYYFEVEQEEGISKYGVDDKKLPNPVIQVGLLMDGNGIPLALNLHPGSSKEEITGSKLIKDTLVPFKSSKLVYYTDANLIYTLNQGLTTERQHLSIMTHQIRKMEKHLKNWVLNRDGWKVEGSDKTINITDIQDSAENTVIYYKERWIDPEHTKRLIVSFSPLYKNYYRSSRQSQRLHSEKFTDFAPQDSAVLDPKSKHEDDSLDKHLQRISEEEKYDGFFVVETTLPNDISEILNINQTRWDIEESFRILQNELKAHPSYLKREDRIKAHVLTSYLSLLIFRILEIKIGNNVSSIELIQTLKTMNFTEIKGEGYVPTYPRSKITDVLHETFGFRTDTEMISYKQMKDIIALTKKG